MKAGDIMTLGAATVRPEASLERAARIMVEHHVSGLPVVDGSGMLVGMLTERDLLRRTEIGTDTDRPRWSRLFLSSGELARQYVHEHSRRVSDIMSRDVVSLPPDASLEELVDVMEKQGFKRIPIVRDRKIIGIVSRANLVLALSRRLDQVPRSVTSDLAIRKHIMDEIEKNDWAQSNAVDIVVRDGVVDLNGTVTQSEVRDALRVVAENAPGAKKIRDNLRVVALPAGYI